MASGTDEEELRLRARPSENVSSRQKHAQNQRQYDNNMDICGDSRLLVWPRRSRNLERPGYVLGWKSSRSTPLTSNRGDHDIQSTTTTTVVCAGVLPLSKPLSEYCRVLEGLKNKHQHQQKQSNETPPQCGSKEPSDKDLGCYTSSLVESLELVAFWDPTDGNNSKSRSTQASRQQQLPRITTSRRYPWWATEEEDQKERSSKGGDRIPENPQQRRQQQQLLYYDLDNRQGQFGHFAVENLSLTSSTRWSRMLVKLNHASTICDIVQSGAVHSVSSPFIPTQATTSAMDSDFSEKRESETSKDSHDATFGSSPLVGWKWLQHKLFVQSFTMLHFRTLCRSSKKRAEGTSAEDKLLHDAWFLMSCFSLLRLLRLLRQRPPHLDRGTRGGNTIFMDCAKVGDSVLRSPSAEAQLHVMYWNQVLMASVDMILGLVVAWVILSWYHKELEVASPPALYLHTKQALWGTLHQNIAWLESFPGGFKLNVPLTQNMGHEIRNLIQMHQLVLSTTLGNLVFLQSYVFSCLAVVGAMFGWSSLLALAVDIWKVEILHITILAACFRALYRSELYLLAALFRLFRGKKRNVLRHRTDSMEYDVMQLLVGTLCFCICIFLWTTILVYYTFFVCWNAILHVPIIFVWMIYETSYRGAIPWGTLFWWRNRHPEWFSRNVHVKELLDDGSVTILRLVSVPESHGSILSKSIQPHSRRFLAWFVSFGLEIFFPRTSTISPHSMPLESLLSQY